jgi:uncharacterized protein YdaT
MAQSPANCHVSGSVPLRIPAADLKIKEKAVMVNEDEVDRFIEKAERELEEADRKIAAVQEAIDRSGFKPSEEVEEKARERLDQYEKDHEYENNQRMAILQDEMYSNQPKSSASSFRRRRGMAI